MHGEWWKDCIGPGGQTGLSNQPQVLNYTYWKLSEVLPRDAFIHFLQTWVAGLCVGNSPWFNLTAVHHPQDLPPATTWRILMAKITTRRQRKQNQTLPVPSVPLWLLWQELLGIVSRALQWKERWIHSPSLGNFPSFIHCCHASEHVERVIFYFLSCLVLTAGFCNSSSDQEDTVPFCSNPRALTASTAGDISPSFPSFPIY